jgi:hypothetical protein
MFSPLIFSVGSFAIARPTLSGQENDPRVHSYLMENPSFSLAGTPASITLLYLTIRRPHRLIIPRLIAWYNDGKSTIKLQHLFSMLINFVALEDRRIK